MEKDGNKVEDKSGPRREVETLAENDQRGRAGNLSKFLQGGDKGTAASEKGEFKVQGNRKLG